MEAKSPKTPQEFKNLRKPKPMIKHNFTGKQAENISIIIQEMEKAGITNKLSQIAMLCLIGEESGFIPHTENMNYSKERLPEVWGIFSKTGKSVPKGQGKFNYNDLAVEHEHDPKKLGDLVYKKLGGFKYRGRFFNQLTGIENYKKYSEKFSLPLLITNPDTYNDNVNLSALIAVDFMVEGVKLLGFDPNGFTDQMEALTQFSNANNGGKMFKAAFPRVIEYSKKFKIENQ